MVHQISALGIGFHLRIIGKIVCGRLLDRFGRTGQADEVIREIGDEFANDFRRVAIGIDGDEDRLHIGCEVRVLFGKSVVALNHALHVEWANVRAIGIAEIDHLVLAQKIRVCHRIAFAVDEVETSDNGGIV